MHTQRLLNLMRIQSSLESGSRVSTKWGLVDSYDPVNYCCKVRIQPEDTDNPENSLTGWLPILALSAGNGFGIQIGLEYDTIVKVSFIDGNYNAGVVELCSYNKEDRPMNVPAGEIWIKHKSGATLKFLNDGTISSSGTWNHDGAFKATTVSDETGSMQHMRDQHNLHTHTSGTAGSPTTAPITGEMI